MAVSSRALLSLSLPCWFGFSALRSLRALRIIAFLGALGGVLPVALPAAVEVAEARQWLKTGDYTRAVDAAQAALREGATGEDWHLVLIQGLLTVGRYHEAHTAATIALAREPHSLQIHWLARQAALGSGLTEKAAALLVEIRGLLSARMWLYRQPPNLVVVGRAALLLGADPKDVLTRIFDSAQRTAPDLLDVYLAKGDLALDKQDYAVAAAAFQAGLQRFPDDPDLHYGLARAFENSDRATLLSSLETALKTNPRHIPSLLLLAEHRIDAEDYDGALNLLDRISAINPSHPEHWAARAVIAHLRNEPITEKLARESALRPWPSNPRVDHFIGRKLSQKYRFAEGAQHQRQALRFDSSFLPARAQLATDLLRLGEDEGWDLARAVHNEDGYHVEAFNLVTLSDTMADYETIANEDFRVRLTSREARIYGPRVIALLTRAKERLTEKYGAELARPTIVELFADPKDFAVRTFGLPDVPGFLGVCFGRVVTANSPASTAANAVNWEAVLWHEFCHVVTLQMTANKMPRWLSEGISVYEERQANPAWGQHMTPSYREMILRGEMAPIGRLSSAFLAPRTPEHLQFAYYQSSLVVEFLVERFGIEAMQAILRDLRDGQWINDAIAAHTEPLDALEPAFTRFARERAEQLAPELDWEKPSPVALLPGAEDALSVWAAERPDNYWALTHQVRQRLDRREWEEARTLLQRLAERYPDHTGADSVHRLLARVHRELGDSAAEHAALAHLAALDGEATDAYLRLMELGQAEEDWLTVAQNAQRFLGVNPLVAPPYRYLAEASVKTGDLPTAISAYQTLLALDPPNPADTHFRLASLLHRQGDASARRHVLEALEEAPRHRSALNLLLELQAPPPEAPAPPPSSPETPP